ncbi:hypothetical protein GCM10007973_23760 [Polymorphobacter multimanifer]|uniref:Glycosyltransferase RgtA/B/C/D-like domain-containing protein n=1 Tax=Polymorphobacter multimanifer TaxID=1070431 RepID=A0A841L139_9SPHN|nr:hypothetical protein [Polymorphobacter multimanifer]MBB6226274.1 hypothetical protein [Polymorphobacter multimanifer]GGI86537.1 hypothetical protein GCM10007973_23760 [Polymorphobacter multimanifer]
MGLLAIPVVCAMSLWNGHPLVYEDSLAYIERPATVAAALGFDTQWANDRKLALLVDKSGEAINPAAGGATVQSGRSLYYGSVAWLLTLVGGLWAVVIAQAALLGIVVAMLWYRCLGLRSHGGFIGVLLGLALATSAGVFANFVMPDILAGILILSMAMLLAFWRRLSRAEAAFLFVVAVFATLSHVSHLIVAAAVLSLAALLKLARPARLRFELPNPALGAAAAITFFGIAGTLAFGIVVKSVTGRTPTHLPHFTAHLVQQPMLAEFLRQNCTPPQPRWAVCAYRNRLPLVWTDFLFNKDAAQGSFATADPLQRRAISEQDVPLALAVLRSDPLRMAGMMLGESGRQLAQFSYEDLSPQTKRRFIDTSFPPRVREDIHQSRLWHDDSALWAGSRIQQIVVLLALPLLLFALHGLARSRNVSNAVLLAAIVCSGVVFNAIVCGVLASPYDRFQARVIWLVPLLAITLFAALRTREASVPTVE